MPSPSDCRFAQTHEWHRLAGDVLTLGISRFAANELTDVTFVQMRKVGARVTPAGVVGEVESVKTNSEIYSALPGEVIEINKALNDDPGLVNRDPFGAGWLCKLRVSDPKPFNSLMDAASYDRSHPA